MSVSLFIIFATLQHLADTNKFQKWNTSAGFAFSGFVGTCG